MAPQVTDWSWRFVRRGAIVASLLIAIFGVSSGSAGARTTRSLGVGSGGLGLDAPSGVAAIGSHMFVTNSANNSVSEVSAVRGQLIATISAPQFGLDDPSAIQAVGKDLFVANAQGNSITEFKASGRRYVQTIQGARYGFNDPTALAASGTSLYVLSSSGVTEVSTVTGALLGSAFGSAYGFDQPTGLAVADGRVFVANSPSNSVSVLDATSLAFETLLNSSSFGFSAPISAAFDGTDLWVTNQDDESVTELSPSTLEPLNVLVSWNLPEVGPITYGDGYVFAVSPPGSSPMVSQIVPSPATVTWMMCNTNGPYLFNDPQSLIVVGSHLWVVNEGGNMLTEMNASSGALLRTVS
jgi:hypothetical protein